jgi:hypothetical protein
VSKLFRFALWFGVLALTPVLPAATASGIWTGQLIDRNGDPQDLSFRFTQSGDALTGKMYGDNESISIADGKLAGNQITFTVTIELNGQISKFVYTGTMEGDEMEVTRERVGNKNDPLKNDPLKPPAGKGNGQNQKQVIRLKRIA